MIRFQNVSATIQGNRILDNINLAINDGEFVLLCGESGCGKTALTRLVNGLIPHFVKDVEIDGTVMVEDMKISDSPMYKIAESVGSVFQNPKTQFFNTDSSAEIAFGLENIGTDRDSMHKRVAKTISDLKIETLANRSVFSLSGGEKQLLAFASVYAMNPQVYVLDEPSANLDHEAMGRLRKILETVKREGHTVLIAEHRLSYLYGLADRIVYLKAGCIERVFTAAEFVGLSESERIAMGLRSICSEEIRIPERTFMQPDSSLAVCHLSVNRKKQPILHDLSLSANDGDIIGIVLSTATSVSARFEEMQFSLSGRHLCIPVLFWKKFYRQAFLHSSSQIPICLFHKIHFSRFQTCWRRTAFYAVCGRQVHRG